MRQQRDEKRRQHAQRRGLRGRAPAEPDRTEHRENNQRDRQDVDDHAPDDLLARVARELLGRHGRGVVLFHNGDDLDIDDVGRAQQQAGNDRAVKQLADGYVGGRAHKDQHDARRDEDAERAAGDDHAPGEGLVVLRVPHRADEQQTSDAPTMPVVAAKRMAMSVAAIAMPPRWRPRATERLSNRRPATPD